MNEIPRVLNRKYHSILEGTYVGRPSKWGNPFEIGVHGTRHEVIEKYKIYLIESGLANSIQELKGQNLLCWCAPLPCHADVLLKLANQEVNG